MLDINRGSEGKNFNFDTNQFMKASRDIQKSQIDSEGLSDVIKKEVHRNR